MEYFLCRAMEIGRLSSDQIDLLHIIEKESLLMPHEIQNRFGVPPLKENYQIPPEDLTGQAQHNQRLRGDFRRAGIYPESGDLPRDLKIVHAFDAKVNEALIENKINLFYMGGKSAKKRFSDEV